MTSYLQIGLIVYLGGLALTSSLMAFGSAVSGKHMPWSRRSRSEREFFGFWLMLWPVSLPIVLYLLATRRGPREVDLDEESVDL